MFCCWLSFVCVCLWHLWCNSIWALFSNLRPFLLYFLALGPCSIPCSATYYGSLNLMFSPCLCFSFFHAFFLSFFLSSFLYFVFFVLYFFHSFFLSFFFSLSLSLYIYIYMSLTLPSLPISSHLFSSLYLYIYNISLSLSLSLPLSLSLSPSLSQLSLSLHILEYTYPTWRLRKKGTCKSEDKLRESSRFSSFLALGGKCCPSFLNFEDIRCYRIESWRFGKLVTQVRGLIREPAIHYPHHMLQIQDRRKSCRFLGRGLFVVWGFWLDACKSEDPAKPLSFPCHFSQNRGKAALFLGGGDARCFGFGF